MSRTRARFPAGGGIGAAAAFVLILSLAGGCRPAGRQAAADPATDTLTRARSIYGFAEWPGKGGALRPGPDATEALAPLNIRLVFHWVRAPAKDTVHSGVPPGTVKAYWQTKQGPVRGVTVWVCTSCDDAHEVLLRRLTNRTAPLGFDARGKDAGVALGDVSFVRRRSTQFVRSNVMVAVRDEAEQAVRLAQGLDKALCAEPARRSLDAVRPRVERLGLAPGVTQPLRVQRCLGWAKPFPLQVKVADPRGRRVSLFWEGTSGLNVREAEPGRWVLLLPASGDEGTVREETVTLTAVNDTGVFATAVLRLKVLVTRRQ